MELEANPADTKGGPLRLLRRPGVIRALLSRLLMGLVVFMFRQSLALILTYRFNVPAEYLGLAFSYQVSEPSAVAHVFSPSRGISQPSHTRSVFPVRPQWVFWVRGGWLVAADGWVRRAARGQKNAEFRGFSAENIRLSLSPFPGAAVQHRVQHGGAAPPAAR
jgi:hypothetical protein